MLLVLDSNEFIFALGVLKKPSCEALLDKIVDDSPSHRIRIPRMIVEEVKRNVPPEAFKEFIGLVNALTQIDEDWVVPFELGSKYESRGLKPADAFIAAFTEWTGSEVLVSENRHFLSRHNDLPFRVLTAESCLKLLTK